MEALYERVLAHVPTQQLHQSYNSVVQEEFASVDAAVDNVVAVFVKLEEVRDAVAQLQQGHESTGGRTASLMATIANAFMLQQELEKKSDKLATGMTVTKLERKRKREEEESKVTRSRVSTSGAEKSTKVATKTTKLTVEKRSTRMSNSSESESNNDDSEMGGSEAAWKALMSNDKTKQLETKAGTYMKTVVGEVNKLSQMDRAFIMPELLDMLKESVEKDIAVISSLNAVIEWCGEGQRNHLGLYRAYAAAVESHMDRLPLAAQTSELQRRLNTLSRLMTSVEKYSRGNLTDIAVTRRFHFATFVGHVDGLSFPDRKQQLFKVLVAFKKGTSARTDKPQVKSISRTLAKVFRELCEDPREEGQLLVYRMLSSAVKCFADCIKNDSAKNDILGLADRMSGLIEGPESSKNHKFLAEIHDFVAKVSNNVKRCQGKKLSIVEADRLIAAVKAVVSYVVFGWDTRQDANVRKCVMELKHIIIASACGDVKWEKSRDARLDTIDKLKIATSDFQ